MTFEEWKVKHDDEIVNVATVFFNYERGVDTRTCYDELEWLLRKAFISGQNHCNCIHTDNSKVIEKLEKKNKRLQHELDLTRGQKGICLEIDGKDMTDVYNLQQQLNEKNIIISFLKKELAHKMSYRQVMKRQYCELKQQKKCNCTICRFERKEISVLKYAQELGGLLFAAVKDKCLADVKEGKMQPSTAKRVIDYLEKPYADIKDDKYSILSWHFLKENPKDLPRNEGWVCNQDGLPCWYDISNDQWIDCEGTQIKTTAWCDMPHTKE